MLRSFFARSGIVYNRLLDFGRTWNRRRHESTELLTTSHRELRDMGLSAADARELAARPFWRS